LADIAVDTFLASSFGPFVMGLFQGLLTAPSRQSFALFACGWALTTGRHTLTTSLWLTGAAAVKHFSRFYVFLGGPFYRARGRVWACIIRHAAQLVPADRPIGIEFDDTPKKKSGPHSEGGARDRHAAGSARQEYRTLWGLNFVPGVMRVPRRLWPGHAVTMPIGLELYLKEEQARQRHLPYRPRSRLARSILDGVVAQLPGRPSRALADGGDATKDFLRDLPASGEGISRFLISGKLYALPTPPTSPRRGPRPRKGPRLGSPKPFLQHGEGWRPHPTRYRLGVP
jgi:DDE superfamily endonuclease